MAHGGKVPPGTEPRAAVRRAAVRRAAVRRGRPPGGGLPGGGLPGQVRRVRYAHCAGTRLPATALVRPDGYVAWASDERDTQSRARAAQAAVRWWCGSP